MKKTYKINGKEWIIEYMEYSHEILDVSVNLSREEYFSLKNKLPDPGVDHKNSSSVDILKNGFAKARGEAALESAHHIKPYEGCKNSVSELQKKFEDIKKIIEANDPKATKEKLQAVQKEVAKKRGEFEQWLRSSNHTLSTKEKKELRDGFIKFQGAIASITPNDNVLSSRDKIPTIEELDDALKCIDSFLTHKLLSPHDPSQTLTTFLDKLEETTATYLETLSGSINSNYDNPITKINEIREIIDKYNQQLRGLQAELGTILSKDPKLSPEQKSLISKDIDTLLSSLDKNNAKILRQLTKLKDLKSILTHEQVDLLLSAQDRGDIYSIGHFIGDQTSCICKSAINITSVLQDRYLLDIYYKKNEVTAAFIEASSELHIRHESHYGARYVNTQTESKREEELPEQGEFSVLPFMKGTTVSDLDKMICLVSGESLSQRSLSMPSTTWGGLFTYGLKRASIFIGLYTLAPVAEITLSAVHLALALPLTVLRILVSPLVSLRLMNNNNLLNRLIENINGIHRFISPVRAFKNLWNAQYKRLNYAGNSIENEHQTMLKDFNMMKNESGLVRAMNAITDPQNSLDGLRLGFHLGYQAIGTIGASLGALITAPLNLSKKTPTDKEIFKQYDENYHFLKPVMQSLITEAEKIASTVGKKPKKFPGVTRQIDYSAESPARVINEIMYLLNDKVIHHLAENHPGPATFFFMMSVATFGSNFASVGALAWMHGAPGYFKLIQSGMAKAFTGYSGPMTGGSGFAHGSVAALLQFKLFTLGTSALLGAGDKNNDILEHMAKNPEEMIAGFVAFVGLGYAMGYVPHIPSIPSSFSLLGQKVSTQVNGINPLDGYSMIFNAITTEAIDAQAGIMPLTALEYGFLGYKTLLWINSMTLNGKPIATPTETVTLLEAFKKEKVLSISDDDARNKAIDAIVDKMSNKKLSSEAFKIQLKNHVAIFIAKDKRTLETKVTSTLDAITKERAQWDQIFQPKSGISYDSLNSSEKLERAIAMLSDKDIPCAFTNKSDAIQYYNQLSRTFDEYNADVNKNLYPGQRTIPKEDFLQAFRNKHISTGSNNLVRLLSFYPGYPFRFLWREAQLKFNSSPYVIDKINASRKKDAALRNDWIAIAKMSTYNFANLCNKIIKAVVGVIPTIIIVSSGVITNIGIGILGEPVDFRQMSVRLQQLGRVLDYIAIQNLIPWSAQRVSFAKDIHDSSRYDDLINAGQKIGQRIEQNKTIEDNVRKEKRTLEELKVPLGSEVSTSNKKNPVISPPQELSRASITDFRNSATKIDPDCGDSSLRYRK